MNELTCASRYFDMDIHSGPFKIKYYDIHKVDKNACAVAALMASCDITYEHAQAFASKYWNRTFGRGTKTQLIIESLAMGNKILQFNFHSSGRDTKNYYKNKDRMVARKMTIKSFLEKYHAGVYYVLIRNHALCVRDSVIFDSRPTIKPNTRVLGAYEIIKA